MEICNQSLCFIKNLSLFRLQSVHFYFKSIAKYEIFLLSELDFEQLVRFIYNVFRKKIIWSPILTKAEYFILSKRNLFGSHKSSQPDPEAVTRKNGLKLICYRILVTVDS